MKLLHNCGSCLIKQALFAMEINKVEPSDQIQIIEKLIADIPSHLKEPTPSHFQSLLMTRLSNLLNIEDLYLNEKIKQNLTALELEPIVVEQIANSRYPLYTAALYSVEGNFLDPIFTKDYDIKKTINEVVNGSFAVNHFNSFVAKLALSNNIVYICDNAGEIVFDRLFIDQCQQWRLAHDLQAAEFSIVVKSGPVLNDATVEDANTTLLDSCGKIYQSGTNYLGLPFEYSSQEVISLITQADLVIAKGQANFETLEEEKNLYGKTFFFLKSKCIHIAEFFGVPQGSSILYFPV